MAVQGLPLDVRVGERGGAGERRSSDSGRSTMRSNSESNQVRASPGDESKSDALRGFVLPVRVVSAGYCGRAEWTYGLDI